MYSELGEKKDKVRAVAYFEIVLRNVTVRNGQISKSPGLLHCVTGQTGSSSQKRESEVICRNRVTVKGSHRHGVTFQKTGLPILFSLAVCCQMLPQQLAPLAICSD